MFTHDKVMKQNTNYQQVNSEKILSNPRLFTLAFGPLQKLFQKINLSNNQTNFLIRSNY